jgi:hypothetical protein
MNSSMSVCGNSTLFQWLKTNCKFDESPNRWYYIYFFGMGDEEYVELEIEHNDERIIVYSEVGDEFATSDLDEWIDYLRTTDWRKLFDVKSQIDFDTEEDWAEARGW